MPARPSRSRHSKERDRNVRVIGNNSHTQMFAEDLPTLWDPRKIPWPSSECLPICGVLTFSGTYSFWSTGVLMAAVPHNIHTRIKFTCCAAQRLREQTDGCQTGRGLGDPVQKMKGLGNAGW